MGYCLIGFQQEIKRPGKSLECDFYVIEKAVQVKDNSSIENYGKHLETGAYFIIKVITMNEVQRYNAIEKLKERLDKIKGNGIRAKIDRDKIRREIKELKMTMVDEEWEMFLSERSEIDVRKIND